AEIDGLRSLQHFHAFDVEEGELDLRRAAEVNTVHERGRRLVERERIAGGTEAADGYVLILYARLDQDRRREIREIVHVAEALLPDLVAAVYLDGNRHFLQRLRATL